MCITSAWTAFSFSPCPCIWAVSLDRMRIFSVCQAWSSARLVLLSARISPSTSASLFVAAVLFPVTRVISQPTNPSTTNRMTTTPTRVLKMLSESIDQDTAKLETPTLSGALLLQSATAVRQGRTRVSGDTQLLLWTKGEALLFEAMLGSIATTGSGPYTHTASPSKYLPSYTMQVTAGGTSAVFRKQAVGMMVDSWEIALAINDNATLGITWVGNGISYTGSGSLDGTDPTGQTAYSYVDGAVTVGGSSIGCVKNITISGNNNLNSDDTCIGRTTISDPERGQFAEITGNVEFELEASDVGYLTDFTNGTQKTLVLTLTNGSSSITITLTMQWQTGITPKVAGTDKITVTGPFKAYVTSGNTDAQTFSIVAVNADSTP